MISLPAEHLYRNVSSRPEPSMTALLPSRRPADPVLRWLPLSTWVTTSAGRSAPEWALNRHNLGIRHWRTNKDEPTNKNAARTGSRTAWISYLEAANRRCPELKGGILRSRRQPDSGARRGSRAPWSCGAGPARARESGTTFSVAATALVAPASQHYRTLLTTQMCSILERLSTEGRRTAGL